MCDRERASNDTSRDHHGHLRHEYEALGPQKFYETHGSTYRNPHEEAIRAALQQAVATWAPRMDTVLDLACGSGEATLALEQLGAAHVDGMDPYTCEAYRARTGRPCEALSFEDVGRGELDARDPWDLCVCSFALHLLDESWLPATCSQLALKARRLLILSPHKRPHIRKEWGWEELGALATSCGHHRVKARLFASLYI
ncbi:unnamed protein product [Pedinophyceae sp. YPF-701]|nr:unnamed protein product [Pedinophyceae sp. YPF-701]